MSSAIPPNAFALPFVVTAQMVDVQQRVSNQEYVGVLSRAAAEHSASLGWGLSRYRELGAWWVVRRHEIDYLQPARLGEELVCHTWPSSFSKARAQRRHVITRPADGALILRALNTWALVDVTTERPRRIPPELIEAFDPAKWRDMLS
jgi:acyl-CoA thioester hydrolase